MGFKASTVRSIFIIILFSHQPFSIMLPAESWNDVSSLFSMRTYLKHIALYSRNWLTDDIGIGHMNIDYSFSSLEKISTRNMFIVFAFIA